MNSLGDQKLNSKFYTDFRSWVNFNMESLSWQGRYRKEFEDFWSCFFSGELLIKDIMARFDYSNSVVKVGPLTSWFNWLKKKFICFVFIEMDCTINELSNTMAIPISELAYTLREFFIDKYPHLEDYFNEKLQISNITSASIHLNISKIKNEVILDNLDSGRIEDEILPSMEVTLYEEWISLLNRIKKDFTANNKKIKNISFRERLKKIFKIVRDVVLLIAVATILIWIIQKSNRIYEDYLLDRISVYEPQLKWLNKNLIFKQNSEISALESKIEYDIEEANPKKLTKEEEAKVAEEIFQTESEVMVTSWDSLPRDINVASFEQSDYEEKLRTGYRDYRYGRNKVYRVLLKTPDFIESRKKLNSLSQKYRAEQVDNVKPGTLVPGGAYYNLYVPRKYLKEFLAQVMEQDQGVLYESKTRTKRNPPGKNKVFIWVKSI